MIGCVIAFILGAAARDVYTIVAGYFAVRAYRRQVAAAVKRMEGCTHARTEKSDPMQWGVSTTERCLDCGGVRIEALGNNWSPGVVPKAMPR